MVFGIIVVIVVVAIILLNNNYIVIRYCYCLLKDKTGFLGDSQISDLLMALGANSLAIVFDEGLLYLKSRMSEIKLQ